MSDTQPYFRLLLGDLDVTDYVYGPVVLSHDESFLTKLEFKLSGGISRMSVPGNEHPIRGKSVVLEAGTVSSYKTMFRGGATFAYLDLENSGLSYVRLECYSSGYKAKTDKKKPETYPSPTTERAWAKDKKTLTVTEIVRGICEDEAGMGCKKNSTIISIPKTLDKTYSYTNQISQFESDWAFLMRLAKDCCCVLYEEFTSAGSLEVRFVDRNTVYEDKSSGIEFVFLGRDDEEFYWTEGSNKFGIEELKPGQIQLLTCTVQEDFSVAIMRIVPHFDSNTGEQMDLYAFYDEPSGKWKYYDLDPVAVRKYLSKGEDQGQGILAIMGSTDSMDFDAIKNTFFKVKEYEQGNDSSNKEFPITDPPHPIRQATASCAGDIRLTAWKSYPIYGISRWYSSDGKRTTPWYALTCKHIWGDSGYLCEFTFAQY